MATTVPASPRHGLLFRAVPDNGLIGASIGARGEPQFHLPNTMVLPDNMMTALEGSACTIWYPPSTPVTHEGVRWVMNFCADADEYRNALQSLDQAFGGKVPIFNHPRAVALSRRDLMAGLMQGVENLVVPRCERFRVDGPDSFAAAFTQHGFSYPVLVRPAGSQTGQGLYRVDGPQDWARLHLSNGYGKWHFMTQFHDYRSANGHYCKVRASFVGGTGVIRAFRDSADWLITGSASALTPELRDSISRNIDRLAVDDMFQHILAQIGARVPLDFFGVDIGVADGTFTFFEANAAMTMARPSTAGLREDPMMHEVYQGLERRLIAHIGDPAHWCAAPHELPSVVEILG
ncbi:MAG: hypothetical protein GC186_06575 [Rhodobacteraceae bacterium]|nr:hypothetical protein [Paracoccaceae bacterium]